MDSRTTNLPSSSSSSDIDSDLGVGLSPWDSLTLSHVLLPVFCALFIAMVVVVIACCLIHKKPKSARHWREKSSHTIESSHDTSDHGVYDVINEANVSTLPLRGHDKLNSNCIFGSRLLRHSKIQDVFPTLPSFQLNTAHTSPQCSSREYVGRIREPILCDSCLQKRPDSNVSCTTDHRTEDEGIYETLDRHWAFRNKERDIPLRAIADKSLTSYRQDSDCQNDFSNDLQQNSSIYGSTTLQSQFEIQSDGNCFHRVAASDNVCNISDTALLPFTNTETNTIVCQLSMFKLSGAQEQPKLIEKAYYHVQPQRTACSHFEDISAMFQSANLRIVHNGINEMPPASGKGLGLILKPAKQVENCIHHLHERNTQTNITEKNTTLYQQSNTTEMHRYAVPPFRKSESFGAANADLSVTLEHYLRHKSIESANAETSQEQQRSTKPPNVTTSPEATRISAKLGPLPPLPVQYQISCEKETSLNNLGKKESSYMHYKRSLKSFAEVSSTHLVQNLAVIQPVFTAQTSRPSLQTDVDVFRVARPQICSDKRQKANSVTREIDNKSRRINSVDNMLSSGLYKVCPEIARVTDTHSLCDNATIERGNDNICHYFVLEPPSDVSSISSDPEDILY